MYKICSMQQAKGGNRLPTEFPFQTEGFQQIICDSLGKISGKTNWGLQVSMLSYFCWCCFRQRATHLWDNQIIQWGKKHPITLLMKWGNYASASLYNTHKPVVDITYANYFFKLYGERNPHTSSFPGIQVWVKISMGNSATSSLTAYQHKACGLAYVEHYFSLPILPPFQDNMVSTCEQLCGQPCK